MKRTLGKTADSWNELAELDSKTRSFVEREYDRILLRWCIQSLTPTEFKVLAFVKGRTLGWQKYAEAIPYSHFIHGLRDEEGRQLMDRHGWPLASGINIAKEETVSDAVGRLVRMRLLTMYKGTFKGRTQCNVYLATSEFLLCHLIVKAGGWLPPFAPLAPGEYLIDKRNGGVFVLQHPNWDGTACVRSSRRWGEMREQAVLPDSVFRRFELDEWEDFRRGGAEALKRKLG